MQILASPYPKLYLIKEDSKIDNLDNAFKKGSGYGLLELNSITQYSEPSLFSNQTLIYWQNFVATYLIPTITINYTFKLHLFGLKLKRKTFCIS